MLTANNAESTCSAETQDDHGNWMPCAVKCQPYFETHIKEIVDKEVTVLEARTHSLWCLITIIISSAGRTNAKVHCHEVGIKNKHSQLHYYARSVYMQGQCSALEYMLATHKVKCMPNIS